ncbi:molybdopterin-dependent oxidoreductase [Sphingomonas piscis]|uniref:Molybdopterin-dependent oxidoreductase n=1 Tax=Sphingomonas piscis TaxID=2714943 RepID=A0A6G7YQK5_9SPHN|nr:molybdopterin cofactor-binding domain-containing protein [Sphingomonas piscis]QIK79014.1 molybdopterin-dependent oxidoreductase [Sphingomonas piscis]
MKGQSQLLNMDRRTVLIGGGIGVGLIVGWSSWRWLAQPQGRNEARFGSYLKIGRDGRVIVAVPQVETGQGIWTALPQLVADELGAAWEMVGVEPAPFGPGFVNPLAGGQDCFEELGPIRRFQLDDDAARITARSTSVAAFEQPMREAGAIARAMLVATAAARWNVAPGACDTRDGKVVNGSNSIGFGELAEEAAGRSPSAPGCGLVIARSPASRCRASTSRRRATVRSVSARMCAFPNSSSPRFGSRPREARFKVSRRPPALSPATAG